MEADACAAGDVASVSEQNAVHWDSTVAEYSNVFEPPGMIADSNTVHPIKLEYGSVPPYKQQYRVFAAE